MRYLVVLLIAACGGGVSTELEGVYDVATWTENTASCDAEGPSVLEAMTDKAMFVKVQDLLGQKFLSAVHCKDVATCHSEAGEDTFRLDAFAFDSGDDEGGYTGQLIVAGGSDTCSGTVTDVTMTSPAAMSIRIEARAVKTKTFQPDKDGFCNTDDAKKAAEGQPCSSLEVTTATFNSDL